MSQEAVIKDWHQGAKALNKYSGNRNRDGELVEEILIGNNQNLALEYIQEVKKKGKS